MTNPENISNINKLNDLQNKIDNLNIEITSLENKWENCLISIEEIEKAE